MSFLKKIFGKNKEVTEEKEIEIEDGSQLEKEDLHENFDDEEVSESIELDDDEDFLEKVGKQDKTKSPQNFDELVGDVKERLEKINEDLTKEPKNLIEINTVKKIVEKQDENIQIVEIDENDKPEPAEVEIDENDETTKNIKEVIQNNLATELNEEDVEEQSNQELENTEETNTIEEINTLEKDNSKEVVSIDVLPEDSVEIHENEPEPETIEIEKPKKRLSFFEKLKSGMEKTKEVIFSGVEDVLSAFTTIDEELFEELEETLIMSDMGVNTSVFIIDELRSRVKKRNITEVENIKEVLQEIISEILNKDVEPLNFDAPTVILVVGVNGAGKTTTIGKLAHKLKKDGNKVMLAAGDTFRAAAIDQLEVWAERCEVPFVKHSENADPSAVVFDACNSAKAKDVDVLLVDTAGRLQNKKNLMEELRKIRRVIDNTYSDAKIEVLLVLDGTTGQNAVIQAKMFNEVVDVTGLVITKLDGTAKGGSIVSIYNDLSIPVRYVGLGEQIDDLEEFNSKDFAKAILD